jgi:hypothetical protein
MNPVFLFVWMGTIAFLSSTLLLVVLLESVMIAVAKVLGVFYVFVNVYRW